MISYKTSKLIDRKKLYVLYKDVGWTAYSLNPNKIYRAVQNSLYVMSAWDQDTLVGLIRAVGDQESILYIQDLLVSKKYQRQGIGSHLLQTCLEVYSDVRQKVLLTDNTKSNIQFYKKNKFDVCGEEILTLYKQY